MRCAKIERMLTPWLDDRLTPAERTLVEQHLEGCPRCRQTQALLQAAGQHLAIGGAAEPPPDLAERATRAAFTAVPAGSTDWLVELTQSLRWPALGTATAAMVLAVGLLTSVPEHVRDAGVRPDSMAAIFATDDNSNPDDELLSEVLGQEEE
jgi:anti-sigma factor RsiW